MGATGVAAPSIAGGYLARPGYKTASPTPTGRQSAQQAAGGWSKRVGIEIRGKILYYEVNYGRDGSKKICIHVTWAIECRRNGRFTSAPLSPGRCRLPCAIRRIMSGYARVMQPLSGRWLNSSRSPWWYGPMIGIPPAVMWAGNGWNSWWLTTTMPGCGITAPPL